MMGRRTMKVAAPSPPDNRPVPPRLGCLRLSPPASTLPAMTARAGHWIFVAVVLVLTAVFVRLGFWQLDRLEARQAEVAERRGLLERRLVRLEAAPFPPADSVRWRRVVAAGRFDYAREAVLSPRSWRGSPAVYVVTPLVMGDSAAVPVIRGSIPAPDGLHAPLERARPVWARSDSTARGAVTGRRPGTRPGAPVVTVRGTAYGPPGGEPVTAPDTLHAAGGVHPVLPRMDLARLDSIWPWRTAGFYVRADTTDERVPPTDEMALPRPVPAPALDEGPHRMYALQWFAFAAIALVGGGIYLWRDQE